MTSFAPRACHVRSLRGLAYSAARARDDDDLVFDSEHEVLFLLSAIQILIVERAACRACVEQRQIRRASYAGCQDGKADADELRGLRHNLLSARFGV
jgi:hypothetical protein